MRILVVGRNSIKRWCHKFNAGGMELLMAPTRRKAVRKAEDPLYHVVIISVLHAPPSNHGFNRTSWTLKLLKAALQQKRYTISHVNLCRAIKRAGYKMWKAKEVLTSNDPEYQQKVEAIKQILATLGPEERFFSIDEFGPFAVKERSGRRFVKADEFPTVPQFQKSKGCLIMTGALELSTNQMTHFYSGRKDSNETIKMMNLLVHRFSGWKTLYLSWDDASWHSSKAVLAEVSRINALNNNPQCAAPQVRLAPLPARSQFLNVIESVFSGMAAAIIENSNYNSVSEAKATIDRHFKDRNEYFLKNAKRAGKKIWGSELVPAESKAGQNCKNPRWR